MPEKKVLSIGFDDTDSPKGMCTTFLAFKIVDELKKQKVEFVEYPKLVRFNPNIPWKTRGNGAVGLKIRTGDPKKIKNKITEMVKKYSDTKNGANPGLVFYENQIPENFEKFSQNAMWKLIPRKEARKFLQENNVESFHLGNGQGLIGALGVLAYPFKDSTLEILAYRQDKKFGTKRSVDLQSVKKMQEKTFPNTFNSYDTKRNKVLIFPRGPDPVLYGIRGEDPDSLLVAKKLIRTFERPQGYMIFQTNQGTDDHLQNELDVSNLQTFQSGTITGIVTKEPEVGLGGHVFFELTKDTTSIRCAVYKKTGLANVSYELVIGDKVRVGGGIRRSDGNNRRTINVEKIEILKLEKKTILENPACPNCHKKMKSKGRGQKYQCIRCKTTAISKVKMQLRRKIKPGTYIPESVAHRHLTKPAQRYGFENQNHLLVKNFHYVE